MPAALTFSDISCEERVKSIVNEVSVEGKMVLHSRVPSKNREMLERGVNEFAVAATKGRNIVPHERVIVVLLVQLWGVWCETLSFGSTVANAGRLALEKLDEAAAVRHIRNWSTWVGKRGYVKVVVRAVEKVILPGSVPALQPDFTATVPIERELIRHQGISRFEQQEPDLAKGRSGQLFYSDADRRHYTSHFDIQARLGCAIPTAAHTAGLHERIHQEAQDATYETTNTRTPRSAFWSAK